MTDIELEEKFLSMMKEATNVRDLYELKGHYNSIVKRREEREFFEQLVEIQKQITPVFKTEKNKVGSNSYSYATLDNYMKVLREPLAERGFVLHSSVYGIKDDLLHLVTHLTRKNYTHRVHGNYAIDYVGKNKPQAFGSTLSYGIRYNLIQMFTLPAEDTDGVVTEQFSTEELIREVEALLIRTKSDKDAFFKWLGCSSLEEASTSQLVNALAKLKKK